ncbi:DnaT-like ssDNA-binding domain-containing protein [Klebsiella quasipneumoniae]|uniref:DnaT-like ssDNA-binding domain-containing protein n=1 Tax=Klebsiella quasipneumoniae TaxID=1463165 RepID=UPI003CF31349
MSSKLHGLVWEGCAQAGLNISRVALMARLADYSNSDGVCWPAIETLMIEIGAKSETTVKAGLKDLVKDGWITKTERKVGGRNLTNIYQINIEKLEFEAALGRKKIKDARAKKKSSRCIPVAIEVKGVNINPSNNAPLNDGSKGVNSDPSKNAPSNLRGQILRGSKIDEKGDLTPPIIAPDPSLTTDPSLNPNQNAREGDSDGEQSRPVPEYPGQPGTHFPAAEAFGKFPMTASWVPSADFRQRVAFWGKSIPEGLNLRAELNAFIAYWEPEGKVFHQSQWEQKFANHLQNAKPTKPRGTQNAGLESGSTANAAVQRAHAARAAQLRARGEGMEVLGSHAGNLLQPLGDQKRLSSVGPVDCADWELDQRPDEERL